MHSLTFRVQGEGLVLRFVLTALDPTKWQPSSSDAASGAVLVADLLSSSLCRTDQFWTSLQTIWQRLAQNFEVDGSGTGPVRLAAVISISMQMMAPPVHPTPACAVLARFPAPLDSMQRACLVVARVWTLPKFLSTLPVALHAQLTARALVPLVLGAMHSLLDLYGEQVAQFFEAHGPDRPGAHVAVARYFANVSEWVSGVAWPELARDVAVR